MKDDRDFLNAPFGLRLLCFDIIEAWMTGGQGWSAHYIKEANRIRYARQRIESEPN
jgi:hypothetical protein